MGGEWICRDSPCSLSRRALKRSLLPAVDTALTAWLSELTEGGKIRISTNKNKRNPGTAEVLLPVSNCVVKDDFLLNYCDRSIVFSLQVC